MIYQKKIKVLSEFDLHLDIASEGTGATRIYVKEGEEVTPEMVVATAFKSDHIITYDLHAELGLKELKKKDDMRKYFSVVEGALVEKGTVLAHKSSLTAANVLKAPFEGFVHIDLLTESPLIHIHALPVEVNITAGVMGKITKIESNTIYIRTHMMQLIPTCMMGGSVQGILKILPSIDQLDRGFVHTIIYYNGMLTEELVKKARAVHALGIIGISVDHRVYDLDNTTFTVVSLEGFGEIFVHESVYERLLHAEHYIVVIQCDKGVIYVGTKVSTEDLKDIYIKQEVFNDTVQVYQKEAYASIGKTQSSELGMVTVLMGKDTYAVMQENVVGILI